MCSQTRFRWRQEVNPAAASSVSPSSAADWAVDDIYIGEECQLLCSGRGDCVDGLCVCDDGYLGKCWFFCLWTAQSKLCYRAQCFVMFELSWHNVKCTVFNLFLVKYLHLYTTSDFSQLVCCFSNYSNLSQIQKGLSNLTFENCWKRKIYAADT